jgi:YesN/AraC family two-component response regulator
VGTFSIFLKKPQLISIERFIVFEDLFFNTNNNVEILLCLSGNVYVNIEKNNYLVQSNQILIIQEGISYSIYHRDQCDDEVIKIIFNDFHISGYEKNQFLQTSYAILELNEDKGFFQNNFLYLDKTYKENMNFAQSELLESIIISILLLLIDKLKENINMMSSITREAREYIETHYKSDITLTMLAEKINFSVYYLSHIFKKEMGCAPMQYLMTIRMEKAKELLQATNQTILDIAQQVGYSNANYFNMLFKRLVGITPGQYRRKSKKLLK